MKLYEPDEVKCYDIYNTERTKRAILYGIKNLNSVEDPYGSSVEANSGIRFLLSISPLSCEILYSTFLIRDIYGHNDEYGNLIIDMQRLNPTTLHGYIKLSYEYYDDCYRENARVPRVNKRMKIKLGWIRSVVKGDLR